jgi:menaquinone-9 beta-reductase
VIAGGGPAGLAAGIVLAEVGLRIIICEPKAYPIVKACGEGVMPSGVSELCKLGIDRYLSPDKYARLKGVRYHAHDGVEATGIFAEGPGWGIARTQLSMAIRRRVSDFSNISIIPGEFTAYRKDADGLIIETNTPRRFRTRLLIGADGLHSIVRREANLDGPSSKLRRWGIRRHFKVAPLSDFVEVYWSDGIEAYITPCGTNMVDVVFLCHNDMLQKSTGAEPIFNQLLTSFSSMDSKLQGVRRCDPIRSAGPFHQRAQSLVADGVILLGDAAGYLDAITGEGISLALTQASLIKKTVVLILNNLQGVPSVHDLQPYARAHVKSVRLYYLLTHLALFFSRHPKMTGKSIQTLRAHPDVFQSLLTLNMGRLTPGRAILQAVCRLSEGLFH